MLNIVFYNIWLTILAVETESSEISSNQNWRSGPSYFLPPLELSTENSIPTAQNSNPATVFSENDIYGMNTWCLLPMN